MRSRRIPVELLRSVHDADWVDRDRRPYVTGAVAYVPVRDGHPWEVDIPKKAVYQGRGYFMAGRIAVFQGDEPTPAEIDQVEAWKKPGSRVPDPVKQAAEDFLKKVDQLFPQFGTLPAEERGMGDAGPALIQRPPSIPSRLQQLYRAVSEQNGDGRGGLFLAQAGCPDPFGREGLWLLGQSAPHGGDLFGAHDAHVGTQLGP